MKTYTTSAQKTIQQSPAEALQTLETALSKAQGLVFEKTKNENIREAKLKDGSVVAIAGFAKNNGGTLAMIDHKKVPATMPRNEVQKKWRNQLDKIL